jgi:hypothetical protein
LATAVTNELLEVVWAGEDGRVAVVLADHLEEGTDSRTHFTSNR